MTEQDLQSQIIKIQGELKKLHDSTLQKEQYIKNRCNEEFDPKINQFELK